MLQSDYRQIDLTPWVKVGEGGNGSTYENPAKPDVLLKLNNDRSNDLASVKEEFDLSCAVAGLGLPTPAMYEIVRVGSAYAAISERIRDKKSLFRICHDEPERIDEMAVMLCNLGKQLFATPCNTGFFKSRRQTALDGINNASFISRKNRDILRTFVEGVPESTGCVHGDYQGGNVILSGGKPYWIDLGRFAYGDPMFDIGHLYLCCVVYSDMKRARGLFHMEKDQLFRFWDVFARTYIGSDDHTEFDRQAARFAAVDILVRTVYAKPSFLEKFFFRIQLNRLMPYFS